MSSGRRRLTIGKHARARMTERGITTDMITEVVTNPDVTVRRSDGCTEYVGRAAGGRLKVVLDEQRTPAFIRTVHWV